ncbi:6-phosphofructokinase 2 [Mycobacterium sp. OAS707]|uniref:1-phosphofructokinase family hexose kinase n=1 Tax=Mycobacterium sp. OAS707 TaxID=2663822 RepID=UPI001788FCD9|nr:1-phosphofructokinase family hexose kinase [Mycobacterium sp. OAS707]MBE1546455.1 6-phosphofructokinase 2 [Mycobacterium sp. OAS707]
MAPTTAPSIVTLTMNPALDICTNADRVRPTDKIRCGAAQYDAGGGGINVAKIAHVLGESVTAVYPAGGPTGDMLTDLLGQSGVPIRPTGIAAATRESFTVNEISSGVQYRFVLPGPVISFREQQQCLGELRQAAVSAQFVVASGSLPPSVPVNFYQQVALICREIGVKFVLDTSGGGLRHITSGVYLLKASVRELRECVGRPLLTESEQVAAAHEIIDCGQAEAVVVSRGAEGAVLATVEGDLRFAAIPMRALSGVGAGDAMVAAITVGLSRGWSLSKSVRYGIAVGAAMLLTPGTQPCTRADAERLFEVAPDPVEVETVHGGAIEKAVVR